VQAAICARRTCAALAAQAPVGPLWSYCGVRAAHHHACNHMHTHTHGRFPSASQHPATCLHTHAAAWQRGCKVCCCCPGRCSIQQAQPGCSPSERQLGQAAGRVTACCHHSCCCCCPRCCGVGRCVHSRCVVSHLCGCAVCLPAAAAPAPGAWRSNIHRLLQPTQERARSAAGRSSFSPSHRS